MTLAPLFVLDAPHYHTVALGTASTFRGVALDAGDDPIEEIVARRAGAEIARAPVDTASPDLAWIPAPRASRCRFSFDFTVPRGAPIDLFARRAGGRDVPVFSYDVPYVERDGAKLAALEARLQATPVPPAEVIATTQGIADVEAYRASTATSFLTMQALLESAGAGSSGLRSILDIGCGTGRLLAGWHAEDPGRQLVGTDINADLIAWDRAHLAHVARWEVNGVRPPLALPDAAFDLVFLASVFTHLELENQRAWLDEIHRVLRPGGRALVTLHGAIYAGLLLDGADAARFAAEGYLQKAVGPEGANAYTTFHAEPFARELFARFPRVAFFPRGVEGPVARTFPLAAQQDVYVLSK